MGMGKKEIQAGIVKAAYLSAGRAGSGRPLHTALMPTAVARQPAAQARARSAPAVRPEHTQN